MDNYTKMTACEKFRSALREALEDSRPYVLAIQQTSGKDRERAWDAKRSFGHDTRYTHLAYAFLRGMPYKVLEEKTGPGNEPSVRSIAYAGLTVTGLAFNEDAIVAWLNGEKPAEILVPEPVETKPFVKVVRVPAPEEPGIFKKVASFFGVGT